MKTRLIFKIDRFGDKIAVFVDSKKNNSFMCYSLYDDTHFDSDVLYLRECKNVRKDEQNGLCAYLKARGYENIEVKQRMKY